MPFISGGGSGGTPTAAGIRSTFTANGQLYEGTGAGTGVLFVPATGKVTLTSGSITTSSTSFVDATGLTLTLTTGANRCLVGVSLFGQNSVLGDGGPYLDLAIDGTRVGGTNGLTGADGPGNGFNFNGSFTHMTNVLSAASHTIKVQWRVTAGVGTIVASAVAPAILWVCELPLAT